MVFDLIEIDNIPDTWTKDQIKIYEIYCEHLAGSDNDEAVGEFEKIIVRWLEESQLKIVSWNCNGKFREKFHEIAEEEADIYVISECENPAESTEEEYREFAGDNYFWQETCTIRDLESLQRKILSLKR